MRLLTPILRQLDRRRMYGRWIDWWHDFQTRRVVRQWDGRNIEPVETRLRGLNSPVLLRVGTTDFCVASEIFQDDEYALALAHAGDPKTIVDLGVNVGLSVLLFAEKFPQARIIGAEPSPANFRLAQRNVDQARLADRVTLHQVCVNGTGGTVDFETAGGAWDFHISSGESQSTIKVPCRRMNSFLEEVGGELDFLKCDIEGAEESVFSDCRDWICKVKVMVIETHGAYTPQRLMDDIQSNGGTFKHYRSSKPQSAGVVVSVREK